MRRFCLRAWWLVFLLVPAGCAVDEMRQSSEGELYVRFNVSVPGNDVKSSLTVVENLVNDVNLFAYYDGILDNALYSDDLSQELGMVLGADKTYNVYALANVGEITAPVSEDDLPELRCTLASVGDFETKGLPLAAQVELSMAQVAGSVDIPLVRLTAKVNFIFETEEGLNGVTVTSVRIMQSAMDVAPFAPASAARAVADGDYASQEDLEAINSGSPASFYVLENCQGVLLEGNTDQWQKVPDNIAEKADLCTYIEVGAEFDSDSGITGSAIYRFFLGQDNTTDFNVLRNVESTVTLKVTEDGLGYESWRIDNSEVVYGDIVYVLNAPVYAGQWGTITFPEATEEHPVTVTWGGSSITIPSSSSGHLGDIIDDGPDLVVYLPSTSKNTLYTCQGSKTMKLSVAQYKRSLELPVAVNDTIYWAAYSDALGGFLDDTGIEILDDGADLELRMYLRGPDGTLLSPYKFAAPEAVRAYLATKRGCPEVKSPMYWYFDLDALVQSTSAGDCKYDNNNKTALDDNGDEEYLFVLNLYGYKLSGEGAAEGTLRCTQNYGSCVTDYPLKIYPSFPNQRHLGETTNYVLALDSDLNSVTTSTFTVFEDYKGTQNANWYIGRGSEYSDGDNEKDIDVVASDVGKALVSAKVNGRNITLTYSTPASIGQYPYLAGGTYHIRGEVYNSHSDETVIGDYSVNIILYMVVGAEVDLYLDEQTYKDGNTIMDFTYLPVVSRLDAADEEEFRDLWGTTCQWCYVYPEWLSYYRTLGTSVLTDVVPLEEIGSFYDGDYDDIYDKVSKYANSVLESNGRDFEFYEYKTGSTATEMTLRSSEVYLELHRLQDVVDGCYLIEDYYNSFDEY